MMKIVSIDPGLRWTGYAITGGISGTLDMRGFGHDYADQILGAQDWLSSQLTGASVLVIERTVHHGKVMKDMDVVHGLIWAMHTIAFVAGVRREEVTASTVRHFFLGRPRRAKGETEKAFDAALKKCAGECGWRAGTEHAVDAILLHEYAKMNGLWE